MDPSLPALRRNLLSRLIAGSSSFEVSDASLAAAWLAELAMQEYEEGGDDNDNAA